jgi:hypothetical protein
MPACVSIEDPACVSIEDEDGDGDAAAGNGDGGAPVQGCGEQVTDALRVAWAVLYGLTAQQKLISKTRTGARVAKTYDTAKTPCQRLLEHPGARDAIDAAALERRLAPTPPTSDASSRTCRPPSSKARRPEHTPRRQGQRRLPLPGKTR